MFLGKKVLSLMALGSLCGGYSCKDIISKLRFLLTNFFKDGALNSGPILVQTMPWPNLRPTKLEILWCELNSNHSEASQMTLMNSQD